MSITLYGLKNCDSCRKALKYIRAQRSDIALVDVREEPPSAAQLTAWCRAFGRDTLVNTRSTTWRGLSEQQKDVTSDAQAVALLREFPTLMKRPVIVSGDTALLGFKTGDVDKLLQ